MLSLAIQLFQKFQLGELCFLIKLPVNRVTRTSSSDSQNVSTTLIVVVCLLGRVLHIDFKPWLYGKQTYSRSNLPTENKSSIPILKSIIVHVFIVTSFRNGSEMVKCNKKWIFHSFLTIDRTCRLLTF